MNTRITPIEPRSTSQDGDRLLIPRHTDEQSAKIIMRRKVGPVELDGAAQEPLTLSDLSALHGNESQICKNIRVVALQRLGAYEGGLRRAVVSKCALGIAQKIDRFERRWKPCCSSCKRIP